MIWYKTVGQWEKLYPFVDAITEKAVLNGAAGTVAEGKFTEATEGTYVVMNNETGDYAGTDDYTIPAGSHVRCLDLTAINGQTVQIYGAQLPETFPSVQDKLKFDEGGKLVSGASEETHFEVTKIIGNKLGVEAKVVAASGE